MRLLHTTHSLQDGEVDGPPAVDRRDGEVDGPPAVDGRDREVDGPST